MVTNFDFYDMHLVLADCKVKPIRKSGLLFRYFQNLFPIMFYMR